MAKERRGRARNGAAAASALRALCFGGEGKGMAMGISEACIGDAKFEETGYSYTMSLIQGKHKMVILYCLMEFQPVRFNEMRRYLGRISDKTLSVNLKELEADGLVARREYPQVPPKVEYSLTERGASLMEVLDQLCAWGAKHRNDNQAAR